MTNYIGRRLILNFVVLLFVASLVFFATRALPSDFAEKRLATSLEITDQTAAVQQARKELGLDKPLWQQYVIFLGDLATGDLGRSYETHRSTWQEVSRRLGPTLQLSVATMLIAYSMSIPIGVLSAVKQNQWLDYVLRGFAVLGVAMPQFVTALFLSLLVVKLSLFEIDVVGRPNLWTDPEAAVKLYAIPALAGGIAGGAGVMRILRSQMLEVMRQDYIRTARSKGLRDRNVWLHHALKNAMLPVLTVFGFTLGGLISGQIILENMFNIDGVGRFLFTSLNTRDFPPFQGTVLIIATVVVTVNLAVDVMYAWLDPRIRYT
ncbi:MAG TPA: ABC transporter permease [Dehalococcoidia bacterium]|nr:ABC transporter permease [Dehalococcoidia bacterium]